MNMEVLNTTLTLYSSFTQLNQDILIESIVFRQGNNINSYFLSASKDESKYPCVCAFLFQSAYLGKIV